LSRFILSPEALGDLDIIHEHIAQDNPEAAGRVIEAAYRFCVILGQHPELGRERHFPGKGAAGIRSFIITDFPNYVIFYRIQDGVVQIVRVLHGARNIDAISGEA
jgi:toxin ParE1/3/4